jgi:hypothetical protein
MTVEVGAVTGVLEVATCPAAGGLDVKVRYIDAGEWYTVEGAPISPELLDSSATPGSRHRRIVEHLEIATPAAEEPTSLRGFDARS